MPRRALVPLVLTACGPDPCPPDMAAVGDEAGVAFCVDRWEVSVAVAEGVDPASQSPEELARFGTLRSAPGVLPAVGLTFDQAVRLCARTPVVVGGEAQGFKRLPTVDEWLDAADGRPGPGGTAYPWGDELVEGRCNFGDMEHGGLAATGSFPDCRTASGVFDQVGNAFEWADTGMRLDVAATLAAFAAAGVPLTVAPDGLLFGPEVPEVARIDTGATAILGGTLRREADGHLTMERRGTLEHPKGVVFLHDEPISSRNALPVEFRGSPDAARVDLVLRRSDDGRPIPAKLGGACYTAPVWPGTSLDHTHDFGGTITFRCVADPVR